MNYSYSTKYRLVRKKESWIYFSIFKNNLFLNFYKNYFWLLIIVTSRSRHWLKFMWWFYYIHITHIFSIIWYKYKNINYSITLNFIITHAKVQIQINCINILHINLAEFMKTNSLKSEIYALRPAPQKTQIKRT